MENASKALIIAGAILISILIISLGIMIYNQASSIVQNNQLQDFEITAFNTKFTQYEGVKTGAQVKTLLQEIISSNSNPENLSRLITVEFGGSGWPKDSSGTPQVPSFNKTTLTNSTAIKANAKFDVSFETGKEDESDVIYVDGEEINPQAGLIYKCKVDAK